MNDSHEDRIIHLEYNFDIAELKRIYEETSNPDTSSEPDNIKSWPWNDPNTDNGRETCGWHYPQIEQMYSGERPWPYEYIKELAYTFNFKNSGFMFFMNVPHFDYPIHFDSTKGKKTDAGYENTDGSVGVSHSTIHGTKLGLSGDELDHYIKVRTKGTECALLVKLEDDGAPLSFTYENQKDWDPNTYTKSPNDHKYEYEACFVNAHWTHYVEGSDKRRLIFRLSIYGESYEEGINRLLSKGLI